MNSKIVIQYSGSQYQLSKALILGFKAFLNNFSALSCFNRARAGDSTHNAITGNGHLGCRGAAFHD